MFKVNHNDFEQVNYLENFKLKTLNYFCKKFLHRCRNNHQRYSIKKVVPENLAYSQENTCL